ncbi:hypothetical protein D3C81_1995160 [compost metagenome]
MRGEEQKKANYLLAPHVLQRRRRHSICDQTSWLSVYGIRARKRARLTAVASWRWYLDLVPVTRLGTILPFSVRYWRRVLRSL